MKIALRVDDTLHWLAGEPGVVQSVHSSAGDLRINGQINIDSQSRVRAASMMHRDRGNLSQDISFTTSRKFDTTADADAWAATYDAVMPRTGYLEFYDEAGDDIARLTNAVVPPPQRTVTGVSVMLSYQVLGGAMLIADGEGGYETPEITMGGAYVTMGA